MQQVCYQPVLQTKVKRGFVIEVKNPANQAQKIVAQRIDNVVGSQLSPGKKAQDVRAQRHSYLFCGAAFQKKIGKLFRFPLHHLEIGYFVSVHHHGKNRSDICSQLGRGNFGIFGIIVKFWCQMSVMFDGLRYEERQQFECSYADMLLSLPSYHDLKDENSYHVLFLGMCAWLSNEYDIISNREEGKGRCDIILKAKKEGLASYVLEFKYLKEADAERLEESAKEAVMQIKEKRYDAELQGRTILIGLAHAGKEVSIEWQER